jgi:carbonic anhydrase
MVDDLIRGLREFRERYSGPDAAFYRGLAAGQSPSTLFVACSDSRIDPHHLTSTNPGNLFNLRNAGNFVPTWPDAGGEAATIEFAIVALHVRHLVICGHSQCGAMAALFDPTQAAGMPVVADWLKHARSAQVALDQRYSHLPTPEARLRALTEESILAQLDHARTHPSVARAVADGALQLHGWLFELESGTVFGHSPEDGKFLPLTPS